MREVRALPPNFDEINAVFNVAGKPVLYAYGDTVFNPKGVIVDAPLRAHEEVHGCRQGSDPDVWWRRYLSDKAFRLDEELAAHIVEYRVVCEYKPKRNSRRVALHAIAARLSSDLYGRLIRYDEARKLIKEGAFQ